MVTKPKLKSNRNMMKRHHVSYIFIKVNPNANCCPKFNLTLMLNITVLPLKATIHSYSFE